MSHYSLPLFGNIICIILLFRPMASFLKDERL
jgi:hypothetical protein